MRILNRVIAASALVVPMGLAVTGVAVADVAAGNPVLPTQIGVSDDDDDLDGCDDGGGFLGLGIGGGGDSEGDDCGGDNRGDDGENGSGLPG